MPVQRCTKDGKAGWRWGKNGKCYTGSGAKAKAAKQGAAIKAAGFQEHDDINMRSSQMLFQKITTNFTGMVRNDTMEGRDYLVAPMIMIVEGVHEGSNGPLYYPAEELAKTPAVWNTKPIVVYHPQANGEGISACDPDILTNRKVGVIMNTSIGEVEVKINKEKTKLAALRAEAWLEVDRMKKVDERIAEAVEKNEMMELSTGLFTDNEDVEGEWNGEPYIAIARNYRPDHLALLPDLVGACSIEDGAGFLRLNEQGDFFVDNPAPDVTENYIRIRQKNPDLFKKESFRTITISSSKGIKAIIGRLKKPPKGQAGSAVVQTFLFDKKKWTVAKARAWVKDHKTTSNEISFGDTRQMLQSMLREKFKEEEYIYVEEVFDDYFVYERAGSLYKQIYNDVDGNLSFKGLPVMVVKKTMYVTKNDIIKNERKTKMAKKKKEKIIKDLIENEDTQWGKDDEDALMELEEDILEKMSPVINEEADDNEDKKDTNTTEGQAAEENTEGQAVSKEEKGEGEETVENMTAEEYINKKVPAELKGVFQSGLASYKANKAKLIDVITSNEKNTFTKEQLEAKDLDELKSIMSLAAHTSEQKENIELLNYTGQGDPINNEMEEEPLELPVLNFKE